MIAAFEFDDGVAAGKAARQADRAHGRFGARADEAHHFDGGHEFDDAARQLRFEFGRRAEGQAVGGDRLHGFDHLRVRVAQDHRPPGSDVVDEAASVGRGQRMRPAAFLKKIGSPPTPRKARTGELTPPGMYLQAS